MTNQADFPDLAELKRLAEAVNQTYADLCEHGGDQLAEAWNSAELAYDDAANPSAVLALIAENERNAKNAAEWEAASLHWMAERDQLKTENERLRKLPTCWSEVLEQSEANDELLNKVLELSRDAERYQWLRNRLIGAYSDWDDSGKGMLGLAFKVPGERWIGCDESIDAAMRKGARS